VLEGFANLKSREYIIGMLSIPITFQYTLDSEIRRVKETLDNLEWLRKNNYKFSLPTNLDPVTEPRKESIQRLTEKEYEVLSYKKAENAILKSWKGNSEFIRKINQKMIGSYPLNEITVILTKYGTQGSYKVPHLMVVNISHIPPEYLIKTVIHESFHLMIEHLIKEYSVEHWIKERIVDLTMDLEYKSRFKMQSVPEWAYVTDPIFKEYYPNIALIIEKMSKIKDPYTPIE